MTEQERERIREVLAPVVRDDELEWMVASCPLLAHAVAEVQRRLSKQAEER